MPRTIGTDGKPWPSMPVPDKTPLDDDDIEREEWNISVWQEKLKEREAEYVNVQPI